MYLRFGATFIVRMRKLSTKRRDAEELRRVLGLDEVCEGILDLIWDFKYKREINRELEG